jgi:hypothetical protein
VGRCKDLFSWGEHDGEVWFKNPETLVDVKRDVLAAFTDWVDNMTEEISDRREQGTAFPEEYPLTDCIL